MSAKYSKLPTEDTESSVIDFGSAFSYEMQSYPKYFSYSSKKNPYKSIFTYSGYRPSARYLDEGRIDKEGSIISSNKVLDYECQ